MAWASSARTCAVEYKAIGNAMRHYTDSGEEVMTDPQPKRSGVNPEKRQAGDAGRPIDLHAANLALLSQARALGFGQLGVASVDIEEDERHLLRWLDAGFHGEMGYMERHGVLRSRPSDLVPGTVRVISVRMDYWPGTA